MIPFRRRPSLGFVWLALVAAGTAAFFAWALQRPRLEEVWRLDIELDLGTRPPLSRPEMARLQVTLLDHPEVAAHLIEDKHAGIFSANHGGRVEGEYAYLVRQRVSDPGLLSVSYAGSRKKGKVAVSARTVRARASGLAERAESFAWRLPDDGPFPQLVEVLLSPGPGQKQRQPVQIDLGSAP